MPLAIEILLHAPIRIQNLHGIDLDRHYKTYGSGPKARAVLEFPAAEVKNSVDLSYPLPAEAAALVAELRGDLAAILNFAQKGNPGARDARMKIKLVAEEGLEPPTNGL